MIGNSKSLNGVELSVLPLDSPLPTRRPTRLRKINNYLLCAKIGTGSSSSVYLAVNERTNQQNAIKRIKLEDFMRKGNPVSQLEREIRLIRRFRHRNILSLVEVLHDRTNNEVCMVLEYAAMGSLGGYIDRGVRLPTDTIFSIFRQVLEAVRYLHSNGFVHQDIKPRNILLHADGRAMLGDFGIGHSFQSAGMVVGSPAFQAPEALDEESDGDSDAELTPEKEDIWALGVTLYQSLFLMLPYVGANLYEIVRAIKERPLEIPEGTDPEIEKLLRGMLCVDPAARLGIDGILEGPLLRDVKPEITFELPEVPKPVLKQGEVHFVEAVVCDEGYTFLKFMGKVRRFSDNAGRQKRGHGDGEASRFRRSCGPSSSLFSTFE
jgi:serine/threonine-protein kinase 11